MRCDATGTIVNKSRVYWGGWRGEGGGGEAVGTQKVNMQLFCGGDNNCVIAIMIMIMIKIKIKIINKAWKCFLSELSRAELS